MLTVGLLMAGAAFQPSGDAPLDLAQQQLRSAAYQQVGRFNLAPILPAERALALQTMQLPAADRQTLSQELDAQRVRLVWLTLWDDRAEDGDIVEVESLGFRQRVVLRHAPVQVAIPHPGGGTVALRGIYDGGGGITVAVQSGVFKVPLPAMTVGQTVLLPVSP